MIKNLKHELFEIRKQYIDENKQVKEDLPVKIHYIHSEKDLYVEEDDAYLTSFNVLDYTYLESAHDTRFFQHHGIVYPVFKKVKKDGSMSKFEIDYPKYGVLKFWVIGKEDDVYEIDFGR